MKIDKKLSASSAWLGFTTAHDRQRIDAFIGRSKRAGFCATELDDFDTLCTSADNQLLHNPDHVLHSLLPPPNVQNYNLRRRTHNIQLPERPSSLIDCILSFVCYIVMCIAFFISFICMFYIVMLNVRSVTFSIKKWMNEWITHLALAHAHKDILYLIGLMWTSLNVTSFTEHLNENRCLENCHSSSLT